jgi:hypothetical protein
VGVNIPAAESLESPKEENEILWKKATDQTGAAYSGKNTFKSGEGEFAVVHQGDNFKASHAYMLLTDVPGASANSGATITARNAGGSEAFVATETTGSTESVAVGAGSEFKSVIDGGGKSSFLQLATEAKRKVGFGSTTLKFPGGTKFSNEVEVSHGLGATPVSVIANSNNAAVMVAVKSVSSTKAKFQATNWFGEEAFEFTVYWVAIG